MTEVLPLLYLHGLSSKDSVPALEEFFGTSAGLSASVVTRLTSVWQQEYRDFAERDLSGVDYVYVGVDSIHFKVRLDQDRVCALVIVGARADGKKELVALSVRTPGVHRVLGRCAAGLQTPRHACAGAGRGRQCVGFWWRCGRCSRRLASSATGCTRPPTCSTHCRSQRIPRRAKALAEIRDAEDREHAEKAITAFANLFDTKHPKAVAKVVDDTEQLLTFYDFPAEHWVHLKTSNPIWSPPSRPCGCGPK